MTDNLEKLATRAVKALRENGFYITTVESCTGGGLANQITNVSGASDVLKGAYVTYSDEAKVGIGVRRETIDAHDVYSTEVAREMAQAGITKIRGILGSHHAIKLTPSVYPHIGVGITGEIVGPSDADNSDKRIFVAVYMNGTFREEIIPSTSNACRAEVKEEVIKTALQMVCDLIEGI
jgi:nicotinamide-nucleotide amidase